MYHSFRVDIATEYGVEEAVFLQNLYFWIEKNKANDKHFYDGRYWTYNTQKAFCKLFPYMNQSKVSRMGKRLEKEGLIVIGDYNKIGYDRTKWYSLTEKAEMLLQGCNIANMQNAYSNMQNEYSNMQNEYTIPDTNTDTITDNLSPTKVELEEDSLKHKELDLIIDTWNENAKGRIKKIRAISKNTKRYRLLNARYKESSLEDILEAISHISRSSFLQGFNSRAWSIDFDWFVEAGNYIKTLEGKFDDVKEEAPTVLPNVNKFTFTGEGY